MKEHLKRLAAGNFIYEQPKLKLDEEKLKLRIKAGEAGKGTFTIKADDIIKGVVWSSDERIIFKNNTFKGKENTVSFDINTCGLVPGDSISCTFEIISSAGEASVLADIKIIAETLKTDGGEAANLFNFANLVQTAPEEAETLFKSENFKNILLNENISLKNLYSLISRGKNVYWSIEEFLIAAKKKCAVTIRLEKEEVSYTDLQESVTDIVGITKSGWGYVSIDVSTDSQFIILQNKRITKEQFTGNNYELQFLLDYSLMHSGRNLGKIYFNTYNQHLEIPVEVSLKSKTDVSEKLIVKERKAAAAALTKEYLRYRMKKNDTVGWVSKSVSIIDRIRGIDDGDVFFKLAHAQLFLLSNRQEEAMWLLDNVKNLIDKDMLDDSERNVELYCYYLYVNSLAIKDKSYVSKVFEIIKHYYENGYQNFRILWLLFYIDSSFGHNQSIKLLRIKDVFHGGCFSPIMYIEAIFILNSQPALLRVLNRFEIQVLKFGCKYNLISERLAIQAADLIANEKYAAPCMINVLKELESMTDSDKILGVLVSALIRNNVSGEGSYYYYEKGLLRGLRITRLYEYYIKSMDKSDYKRLPKMVLMYFSYESDLDFEDKAYLYANILTNENTNEEIMALYDSQMEKICYEQLKKGNIDDNILVLYRYFWKSSFIDEITKNFMLGLLFTYKVSCFGSDIKNVIIKHKELQTTEKYAVSGGCTYVRMYTENCAMVFEDEDGNYLKDSINYEIEKVFDEMPLVNALINAQQDNIYAMLYCFEAQKKLNLETERCADIARCLIKKDIVEESVKLKLNSWLIEYYDKFYAGDDFNVHFKSLYKDRLIEGDAIKLMQVCIFNGMYEDAFDLIKIYGFSGVEPIKLMRMARRIVQLYDYGFDHVLTEVCYCIFVNKIYDEIVLEYLAMHFNGTTLQMYDVWKACQNFNVDNINIAERFIAQMLFTGQNNGRQTEVFGYYCANGGRRFVIDAYVSYHSFLYFSKHKKVNDIVFKVIEEQIQDCHEMPEICYLALLKKYSSKTSELADKQLKLAEQMLDYMCSENIFFEFYKKFASVISCPYNAINKTVVEYCGNPKSKVKLYYITDDDGENWHEETMTGRFGVFAKCFTLFYADTVKYYFTEEINGEIKQSDIYSITNNDINPEHTQGRFEFINDILASRQLHDMATMKKLMQGYCVQDYVAQEIFKPF